jgi:hypothetical protein
MSLYSKFGQYEIHKVWRSADEELRVKAKVLWQRNHALGPTVDIDARAREIVLLALNEQRDAIGVNTAYTGEFKNASSEQVEHCSLYRMFIQPQDRVPYLMAIMTKAAFDVLSDSREETDPKWFVIVIENANLDRPGIRRVFERNGLEFAGLTSRGQSMFRRQFLD